MKRQLAALACALSVTLCHAQQALPAERALPNLEVRGANGLPVELTSLDAGAHSVLIVLDASMPSALQFLAALNAKGEELDVRIKILVLGDEGAAARLQARAETLRGGTWLQADHPQAIRDLQLPGIPCMLGLDGERRVAWQFSGISNPPERTFFMARDWLQASPAPLAPAQ
jgi:hypothetical protein